MCYREGAAAGRDLATLEGRLVEVITTTVHASISIYFSSTYMQDQALSCSVSSATPATVLIIHFVSQSVLNAHRCMLVCKRLCHAIPGAPSVR
jgi:hypothetical protein